MAGRSVVNCCAGLDADFLQQKPDSLKASTMAEIVRRTTPELSRLDSLQLIRGVEEKNIDVSLTGERLTVSGFREEEERHESVSTDLVRLIRALITPIAKIPAGMDCEV